MPRYFLHITLTTLLFCILSLNFLTVSCRAESPATEPNALKTASNWKPTN